MKQLHLRGTFYFALWFIYLPVLVLMVYSFNDARFAMTWQGFTLKWYRQLFNSPETALALQNTLIVSTSATLISTLIGTLLAIGLHLFTFPGKRTVEALFYLPIIVPDIIMAVSLLAFYVLIHLSLGYVSIIIAHISFQVSFVMFVVKSRLQDFPQNVLEAARDLGASPGQVLWRVVLPIIRPGIIAAGLIGFTLSVDDFLITYFTAGAGTSTLPIRIYSMVKRGVTPDINALSTLMLAGTLVLLYIGLKLMHPKERV